MGSGNGRPGTQQKLNRYDLEDFNPHRSDQPSSDGATSQENTPVQQQSELAESHPGATPPLAGEPAGPKRDPGRRRSPADAYRPLHDFLETFDSDTVMISFAALENMIRRKLPPSARQRETWWTNRPRGQGHAKAWRDLGWQVERVDLERGRVTFTRLW
ncbi:MAG: DUF7662 domain-containing protein [Actinomycetota bacterium]